MILKMSKKTFFSMLIALLIGGVVGVVAQGTFTPEFSIHLFNSLIDSTPIGQTTPSSIVGTSVTSTGGTNSVSGYQMNGLAPTNHTLCGNGTYYVDSGSGCSGSVNPTINDVTFSRSLGGTYSNGGRNQMVVHVTAYHPGSYSQGFGIACSVNGIFIAAAQVHNDQGQTTVSCEVPAGDSYSVYIDNSYVSNPQTPTLSHWIEEVY